jgi:Ubiquitin family
MPIQVNVRLSDASTFSVEVESTESTVEELKLAIEPKCTPPAPPNTQKLVFKGRIMKDADTLQSYGK